jgi:hypothetical protein
MGGDVRAKALPIRFGKTRLHSEIRTRFTSMGDRTLKSTIARLGSSLIHGRPYFAHVDPIVTRSSKFFSFPAKYDLLDI